MAKNGCLEPPCNVACVGIEKLEFSLCVQLYNYPVYVLYVCILYLFMMRNDCYCTCGEIRWAKLLRTQPNEDVVETCVMPCICNTST